MANPVTPPKTRVKPANARPEEPVRHDEGRNYLDPAVLSAVSSLEMVARMVVEGFISGLQKSPYHGYNVEFSEHRHYMPGDEIRHIDWKVLGKSDKLYVKQFEEETNLRAYVLLDVSRSMGYGEGGQQKIEYGRYLAASLAYLMLHQRDGVGLVMFDDDIKSYIPPRANTAHLQAIIEELDREASARQTNIADCLTTMAGRIPRRGLLLIITDLLDDQQRVLQSLRQLRHHRHEVVVFHLIHPDELNLPFKGYHRVEDAEGGSVLLTDPSAVADLYRQQVQEYLEEYRDSCYTEKIDYVLMDTSKPLDVALFAYLAKRHALRAR